MTIISDYYKRLLHPILIRLYQKFYQTFFEVYNIKNLIKYGTFDFFNVVEIETITACNRRCSYCPNSYYDRGSEKKNVLDEKLYKKIIDDLSKINFTGRISPHLYGEPLLDTRLFDFVKYTKMKIPKCNFVIYTNGDFLTNEKYEQLVNVGVDSFIISLHDRQISKNPIDLLEYKNSRYDNVKIVLINIVEEKHFNRGGEVEPNNIATMLNCYLNSMHIDYEGNAILCCNDYHSSVRFGNLSSEFIYDIWNKKDYKEIRYQLKKGCFHLDICRKCNVLD